MNCSYTKLKKSKYVSYQKFHWECKVCGRLEEVAEIRECPGKHYDWTLQQWRKWKKDNR